MPTYHIVIYSFANKEGDASSYNDRGAALRAHVPDLAPADGTVLITATMNRANLPAIMAKETKSQHDLMIIDVFERYPNVESYFVGRVAATQEDSVFDVNREGMYSRVRDLCRDKANIVHVHQLLDARANVVDEAAALRAIVGEENFFVHN